MFKKLSDEYKKHKEYFLDLSPKGKWLYCRNIGIFVLRLTGVPVLDPDWRPNWYSYTAGFVCLNIFISFFYTIWYYIDEPITAILVTPLFGVVVPSALTYFLSMIPSKRKAYRSLALFAGDKIYTEIEDDSDPSYIRVCNQSAIKLFKSTSKTVGILMVSLSTLFFFPLYAFIFNRDIQFPIPVILPFTNVRTRHGIMINVANQVLICLIGSTGNIGIEIITCMIKNNVWCGTVVIYHAIDEISFHIENQISTKTKKYIGAKFRNILIQIQDLDRYILQLSDLYYWKFFLQPIMLTFSVSIAIFFYLYNDWVSGLGAAFLTYSQLFILCDIGNEVDSANKMLVLKFHEMSWYSMTKQQQLAYAHVLNRLQNGSILRIGPFALLNFETFSKMTNKIYTVLAMLIRITK